MEVGNGPCIEMGWAGRELRGTASSFAKIWGPEHGSFPFPPHPSHRTPEREAILPYSPRIKEARRRQGEGGNGAA